MSIVRAFPLLCPLFVSLVASLLGCSSAGNACADCRDEKCADLAARCVADAGCACMSECVGKSGIPGVDGCLGSCRLGERPAAFHPLEECLARACPDSGDECASGGHYTPPADAGDGIDTEVGIGAGDLPECSFDAGLAFDPNGTVLQLESADKSVCLRLERKDDGGGSLANTQWTLLDVRLGPLGSVAHVADPTALCWYSSHHNFIDWAHVSTSRVHYDLELEWDGHDGRSYRLHAFGEGPPAAGACAPLADGRSPLADPIELFPVNR